MLENHNNLNFSILSFFTNLTKYLHAGGKQDGNWGLQWGQSSSGVWMLLEWMNVEFNDDSTFLYYINVFTSLNFRSKLSFNEFNSLNGFKRWNCFHNGRLTVE